MNSGKTINKLDTLKDQIRVANSSNQSLVKMKNLTNIRPYSKYTKFMITHVNSKRFYNRKVILFQ